MLSAVVSFPQPATAIAVSVALLAVPVVVSHRCLMHSWPVTITLPRRLYRLVIHVLVNARFPCVVCFVSRKTSDFCLLHVLL